MVNTSNFGSVSQTDATEGRWVWYKERGCETRPLKPPYNGAPQNHLVESAADAQRVKFLGRSDGVGRSRQAWHDQTPNDDLRPLKDLIRVYALVDSGMMEL